MKRIYFESKGIEALTSCAFGGTLPDSFQVPKEKLRFPQDREFGVKIGSGYCQECPFLKEYNKEEQYVVCRLYNLDTIWVVRK